MDNKDFDKIFSNKLEETQSFEFRESDWEEVSERLQQPKRKKRTAWWFWMLAAACLVMGLTMVYLAVDLNNTKQELANIQESLQQQSQNTTTTQNPTSPIENSNNNFNNQTTQDDILEQINKQKPLPPTKLNTKVNPILPTKTASNTTSTQLAPVTKLNNNSKPITTTHLSEKVETKKSTSATTKPVEINKLNKKYTNTELLALNVLSAFPLETKGEKPIGSEPTFDTPLLNKQTTRKSRLGFTAGWSLPENFIDVESNKGEVDRNAFDIGLHYSYDLTKRMNAWTSISFHSLKYKTKNISRSANYGLLEDIGFPAGGDEDTLEQQNLDNNTAAVDATRNVLRYSLGLNYFLLQKNRWGLYTGLSAHAQTKLNNKIFIDESRANVNAEFSSLDLNSNKKLFQYHTLAAQIGCRFDLNNNLSWQLEAFSQPRLWRSKSTKVYEPFGLRTILAYKF